MTLSEGAIDLPMAHLSIRVPWNDQSWEGRVCKEPGKNNSCTVLKNVYGKKKTEIEEEDAGRPWSELVKGRVPPCALECGGFMRTADFTAERKHAYASGWTQSHVHFAPTQHRMPPYSVEAVPYRWVMRDVAQDLASRWGIAYDYSLEESADKIIEAKKELTWVQDHRNQIVILDSFFSAIAEEKSIVLLYAKDVPLLEERPPGTRILIGAGRVRKVYPYQEWSYKPGMDSPIRSILWERTVLHTIRPEMTDGFLLPYQALLRTPDLQGEDLARFVAHAPTDHFEEFSYAAEHVSHDGAIAALIELARIVELLPAAMEGPWSAISGWISDRIAESWDLRGPYPGLGPVLTAVGIHRGALIAHRVVESLDDPSHDPWPATDKALRYPKEGPAKGLAGRAARKAWQKISKQPERLQLLRLLARFPLTTPQASRIFDIDERAKSGITATDLEIIENPYLIYEIDRGRVDSVGFHLVDRGLFPQSVTVKRTHQEDELEEPVDEPADDRRVRAAVVHLLERASDQGHTLLDEATLRARLELMEVEPKCQPSSANWSVAVDEFEPVLKEVKTIEEVEGVESSNSGWQLARLAEATDLIASEVEQRIARGALDIEWDWRESIDDILAEIVDDFDEKARQEKAQALSILARSRVSVLVGQAGTGKTTMLRALCAEKAIANGGVLLLAPTGKARVQLSDKVGLEAYTVAQFLRRTKRWNYELGYRIQSDRKRESGYRTVIIDEASMLTEVMLAAIIDSLMGVDRIILCGDHRQLPPIGAGRPFVDLVRYLPTAHSVGNGGGVAMLTVNLRQRERNQEGGRDDLAIASMFSVNEESSMADEVLARVLEGEGDGTVDIKFWDSQEELDSLLVESLCSLGGMNIVEGDTDSLKRSLGACEIYNGRPSFKFGKGGKGAEAWQILSPIRNRRGGVTALHQLIRRVWRQGDLAKARRYRGLAPPLGPQEILFHDKVICVNNHQRTSYSVDNGDKPKRYIANGEIGMAVHWISNRDRSNSALKVEFSTQPGYQFTFWGKDLDPTGERTESPLELAYAVTIHKAQGSEFGTTLVVIPSPCPVLSPELLYTALTRQKDRAILFVQEGVGVLKEMARPSMSETGRRLTRLFRAPRPFRTADGDLSDASHIHRTIKGEPMRSKSEVIVANILESLGVRYAYELPLRMPDGSSRSPDFTLQRPTGKVYWEHLGMLEDPAYEANWRKKKRWYAEHGILPWNEGGGPNGTLVYSTEGRSSPGIDSEKIKQLAREALGVPT